jgi:hypothetical protein
MVSLDVRIDELVVTSIDGKHVLYVVQFCQELVE